MQSKFLPGINSDIVKKMMELGQYSELYDLFTQPLHEELYQRQSFAFLDELSGAQQLLLSYDYVRMQVLQGGFIQFIHNGYIALLPKTIELLGEIGLSEMAKLMDDVLKVFVLNKDLFDTAESVQEFAKLYDELKEFEIIDDNFAQLNDATLKGIIEYVIQHINDVAIFES